MGVKPHTSRLGRSQIYAKIDLMSPEKGKLRPPPVKAYENQEFLLSPQARTLRVMAELTEPY